MGDVLPALHWTPDQLLGYMNRRLMSARNRSFEDGTWKFNWVPCFSFLAQRSIICSPEMDESDLCSALIHGSLSTHSPSTHWQWMGPYYAECFFFLLISKCFFFFRRLLWLLNSALILLSLFFWSFIKPQIWRESCFYLCATSYTRLRTAVQKVSSRV